MKYEVNFFTIEIKNGQELISNSQDFEFTNENPLLARRDAIAKAKELIDDCVKGKRFVSIEPQLEMIDLTANSKETGVPLISSLNWIINGGESGHTKRPFDTDWGRKLRDDSKMYKVPFFFKQIDKIQAIPGDLLIRELPELIN